MSWLRVSWALLFFIQALLWNWTGMHFRILPIWCIWSIIKLVNEIPFTAQKLLHHHVLRLLHSTFLMAILTYSFVISEPFISVELSCSFRLIFLLYLLRIVFIDILSIFNLLVHMSVIMYSFNLHLFVLQLFFHSILVCRLLSTLSIYHIHWNFYDLLSFVIFSLLVIRARFHILIWDYQIDNLK